MAAVSLLNTVKHYGQSRVIHGIDLEVNPGEFCVFVGPSGCGKSTLLRMIAGLESTTSGQIFIGNRDVTNIEAADRKIAMVFQTYALYPHMSVRENMGFGLKMNRVNKREIAAKVDQVASILQLEALMDRKPKALSGGQRQRVAIGRALVRGPEVFLFDEPLSNLDAELRVQMRVEIARLHQEIGATMIYVTHDQVEAMTLADKIVVLQQGKVEQVGTPMQLYTNPSNKFVAGFIGSPAMNFVNARVHNGHITCNALTHYQWPQLDIPDADIIIGLRPEHLSLHLSKNGLQVDIVEQLGGNAYVHALCPTGEKLVVEHKSMTPPRPGKHITVSFDAQDAYFFDAHSEVRLQPSSITIQ